MTAYGYKTAAPQKCGAVFLLKKEEKKIKVIGYR